MATEHKFIAKIKDDISSGYKQKIFFVHSSTLSYKSFGTVAAIGKVYENQPFGQQSKTLTCEDENIIKKDGRFLQEGGMKDFLLPPVVFMSMNQVDSKTLILLVKHKKRSKKSGSAFAKTCEQFVQFCTNKVVKEITLQFDSSEDRSDAMAKLLEHSRSNPFVSLMSSWPSFADAEFVKEVNLEIWKRIILGDDILRMNYLVATGGSVLLKRQELVCIILETVTFWLCAMLNVTKLTKDHGELFAELFAVALNDRAVRAFLHIFRPAASFLQGESVVLNSGETVRYNIFDVDNKDEENTPPSSLPTANSLHKPRGMDLLTEEQENVVIAFHFVKMLRLQMKELGENRIFLGILKHPAFRVSPDREKVEELETVSIESEFDWFKKEETDEELTFEQFQRGVAKNSPYLAFLLISRQLRVKDDDVQMRRALESMYLLPSWMVNKQFLVTEEGILQPYRAHFRSLIDYCKLRETWRILTNGWDSLSGGNTRAESFIQLWLALTGRIGERSDNFVKMLLPSNIPIMNEEAPDPNANRMLSRMRHLLSFSSASGTSSSALNAAFSEDLIYVLAIELIGQVSMVDSELLKLLGISSPTNFVQLRHDRHIDKEVNMIKRVMVARLMEWSHQLLGSITDETLVGLVFAKLFSACASSFIIRAIVWLFLPTSIPGLESLVVTNTTTNLIRDVVVGFCNNFVASLDKAVLPPCNANFASFLQVVKHPFASKVDQMYSHLSWREESGWFVLMEKTSWVFPTKHYEMLLQDTPNMTLLIIVQIFNDTARSVEERFKVLSELPVAIRTCSFQTDVTMFSLPLYQECEPHYVTRAHLWFFGYNYGVAEVWRLMKTNATTSYSEFDSQVESALCAIIEEALENNKAQQSRSLKVSAISDAFFVPLSNVRVVLNESEMTASLETVTLRIFVMARVQRELLCDASSPLWETVGNLFQPNIDDTSKEYILAVDSVMPWDTLIPLYDAFIEFLRDWCRDAYGRPDASTPMIAKTFVELFDYCLQSSTMRAFISVLKVIPNRQSRRLFHHQTNHHYHHDVHFVSDKRINEVFSRLFSSLAADKYVPWRIETLLRLDAFKWPGVSLPTASSESSTTHSHDLWNSSMSMEDEHRWCLSSSLPRMTVDIRDLELAHNNFEYLLLRWVCSSLSDTTDKAILSVLSNLEKHVPSDLFRASFRASYCDYLPYCFYNKDAIYASHFVRLTNFCYYAKFVEHLLAPLLDVRLPVETDFGLHLKTGLWNLLWTTDRVHEYPPLQVNALLRSYLLLDKPAKMPSLDDPHGVECTLETLLVYNFAYTILKENDYKSFLHMISSSLDNAFTNSIATVPTEANKKRMMDTHNLLCQRIIVWTKLLLGDQMIIPCSGASLVIELWVACMNDPVFRAFLMIFVPAKGMIDAFNTVCGNLMTVDAALLFVRFLAKQLKAPQWSVHRTFINIVKHPMVFQLDQIEKEIKPTCLNEAEWITEISTVPPIQLSYDSIILGLSDSPYLSFLLIRKSPLCTRNMHRSVSAIPSRVLQMAFEVEIRDLSQTLVNSSQENNGAVTSSTRIRKIEADRNNAPYFIGLCLRGDASIVDAFLEKQLFNDSSMEMLLQLSVLDLQNPHLRQVYDVLVRLIFNSSQSEVDCWNESVLKHMPSLAVTLVDWLYDLHALRDGDVKLVKDEQTMGLLTLLPLQLQHCREVPFLASHLMTVRDRMRTDSEFEHKVCFLMEHISAWFSRLCVHYNTLFNSPANSSAYSGTGKKLGKRGSAISKVQLSLAIVGFFELCFEFRPSIIAGFLDGLGAGRPFFSFFMHHDEWIAPALLSKIAELLRSRGTLCDYLIKKLVTDRQLIYDNDHFSPAAIDTLLDRHASMSDEEYTGLLVNAFYFHDLTNLHSRIKNVVLDLIGDQDKRQIFSKFTRWVNRFFIKPDIHHQTYQVSNDRTIERVKWRRCTEFVDFSIEDLSECAEEAKLATFLLKSSSRGSSHTILEQLFQHYMRSNPPSTWKLCFRGAKTIAYFIKYVDREDLLLAFREFRDINPGNYIFLHHLYRVRQRFTRAIVSAEILVSLTTGSSVGTTDNSANTNACVTKLMQEAAAQTDRDMWLAYSVTAIWMKVTSAKLVFPLPPRNAQLIILLVCASWAENLLHKRDTSMGRGMIAQVGTGEGKSLIIAMVAIYFNVVLKKRVHILENNSGLLEKDIRDMEPFFAAFNIKRRRTGEESAANKALCSTSLEILRENNADCSREFAKFGVTYCLRRNLERYYQQTVMQGNSEPFKDTVLIVDEVDDIIVDEAPNQAFGTVDVDTSEFRNALEFFKQPGGLSQITPAARQTDFAWDMARIAVGQGEALTLGEHYAVFSGRYCMLDNRRQPMDVYDLGLEYLNYRDYQISPVLRSNYYVLSVPHMFQQYDCISGFSGSLGSPSERKFLREQYNIWSFDTPSFLNTCVGVRKEPPKLLDDASCKGVPCVQVYPTAAQQWKKVVDLAVEMSNKVPVLVICSNPLEAEEVQRQVSTKLNTSMNSADKSKLNGYVQLFLQYKAGTTVLDKDRWGDIVKRATKRDENDERYYITVTDPFGGRGHDFDVHNDTINANGGMLVILTSIPASDREWRQWKGRTSRRDNKGQYAVILNAQVSPVLENVSVLQEHELKNAKNRVIPHMYNEQLIERLFAIQDLSQGAKLLEMEEELKMGKLKNVLSDAFYGKYQSVGAEWPKDTNQEKLRDKLTFSGVTLKEYERLFTALDLTSALDASRVGRSPPNSEDPSFFPETEQRLLEELLADAATTSDGNSDGAQQDTPQSTAVDTTTTVGSPTSNETVSASDTTVVYSVEKKKPSKAVCEFFVPSSDNHKYFHR